MPRFPNKSDDFSVRNWYNPHYKILTNQNHGQLIKVPGSNKRYDLQAFLFRVVLGQQVTDTPIQEGLLHRPKIAGFTDPRISGHDGEAEPNG